MLKYPGTIEKLCLIIDGVLEQSNCIGTFIVDWSTINLKGARLATLSQMVMASKSYLYIPC